LDTVDQYHRVPYALLSTGIAKILATIHQNVDSFVQSEHVLDYH